MISLKNPPSPLFQRGNWIPLLFAISSSVYFLSDNEADNDLWIHVLTGREILAAGTLPVSDTWSFTTRGAAWVDHEWLAQVIFAFVFQNAGGTGLWLLKLAIGLATALLLWRMIARRAGNIWVHAAVLTLAIAVMSRGFAIRPQIFTYLATALLLDWLDRRDAGGPRPRPSFGELAAIAALFVFWANVHGGFVFGLGLLGLYAVLPPWRGWASRAPLLITAVLATCVNPYGASLLTYIAHELQTAHPITEWQASSPSDPALFSYFFLLAAVVLTLPFSATLRTRPWHAALVLAVVVMSLRHQRHAPLLALCASGALAEQVAAAADWLQRRTGFAFSPAALRLLAVGVAALALLQLAFTGMRIAGDGPQVVYDAREYPVHAIRFLRAKRMTGNIAVPLDWGGYVLWHGRFELRVSLDGRFATVFPPEAVTTNFAFYGDGPAHEAARMIDDYGATIVLAPAGLHTPAHDRAGWTLRYRDEVAEVLALGPVTAAVTNQAAQGRIRFP